MEQVKLFQEYLKKNNLLVAQYDTTDAGVEGFVVTDMQRVLQMAQIYGEMTMVQAIVKVEDLTTDMVIKLFNYYCKSWLNIAK